ncbi:enoyl-CoA hydratase-related protein [Variovorax sp. LjRoot84]|uniref:enoyl-CoA hydratase/isomerase family protein n=1 Tax=Variovorax sp. LjRoot84 TaxID=3342340 RepID=UPI003ECE77C5
MPDVRLETLSDGVSLLRLDRPAKLNALSDAMVADAGRLLDSVGADTRCRVLVISGSGRGFCAGFDLASASDAPGNGPEETALWMRRQEAFAGLIQRLRALPQPVIAAVNGAASGAGLGIALACDIRIAASSARFNSAFVRVGMSSCDMGVSWLLPRCIGLSRAFEMMLTGRMVKAEEADRIGLVSEVVDDGQLMARVCEIASLIVANSAFGAWMTKRGMWANVEASSLQAAMELENRTQILCRSTGELQAAAGAMLDKRRGAAT